MALCPFAEHKLLPESRSQGRITPRMFIVHSTGAPSSKGLYDWWMSDQSRGLESHFWIGDDGRLEQYIDTEVRADANGAANGYALSCETNSSSTATEPWTPAQAATLVRLIDWCCATHDIPRRLTATATGSGLAWHVQFGAPGPWTPSKGKVCPGPARITQFQHETIPAVAGGTTPNPEELDMDENRLRQIIREELEPVKKGIIGDEASDNREAANAQRNYGSLRGWLAAVAEKVGATREDAVRLDPTAKRLSGQAAASWSIQASSLWSGSSSPPPAERGRCTASPAPPSRCRSGRWPATTWSPR